MEKGGASWLKRFGNEVNINVLQFAWKFFFKWISYFRRSVKEVIFCAIIERQGEEIVILK